MTDLIHNVLPQSPRPIAYIHPDNSVKECIAKMVELDIGALVVLDDNEQLQGIVSERDIVRSCLAKSSLEQTKACEIAFKDVTILSPHDPIEKAMQVMTATKRRHILIRDNNALIAILSIGDLLHHMLEDKARVIEHLEHYIHN
ncbi:MAG: CBS domain-containing protein [Legionella sp.]